MIICKLQGGLGNQMFQYAYTKHLALKYNINFCFDLRFYDNYQGKIKRSLLLNEFQNLKIVSLDKIPNQSVKILTDDFKYKEFEPTELLNYYLDGYWQSERYFKESESIIKNDFLIDKPIDNSIISQNTVSLHVRRTDYVTSNDYHPVQSIDYYKRGLDLIGDYDKVLIFSDDINWCKENLSFNNMTFIEGNSEVEDLHLMSCCKHNIIANSTFSWWAAWLNRNVRKKVIAPKNWFGAQTNINTSDIIPKDWIKI
jgi:hypothetical protein